MSAAATKSISPGQTDGVMTGTASKGPGSSTAGLTMRVRGTNMSSGSMSRMEEESTTSLSQQDASHVSPEASLSLEGSRNAATAKTTSKPNAQTVTSSDHLVWTE